MASLEVNFDGIVGPTHNYAGLAEGNLAAAAHKARVSNPREAARQGLRKMARLVELGLVQGVFLPQERPNLRALRGLGFSGGDADVLAHAARDAPHLLAGVSSASSMWAANAATVTPSVDAADGRLHFTPANLQHHFHRSLEADATRRALETLFTDPAHFVVHPPLPSVPAFGDEGAANHTRLCRTHGGPGLHVLTYGRLGLDGSATSPSRFPARQTREAFEAIARRHGIAAEDTVFVQQSPAAVDAGVFHNDVIAVGNEDVLLLHAAAWVEQSAALDALRRRFAARTGGDLRVVEIAENDVSVDEAVRSYLFNTQLLTLPDGDVLVLAPLECRESEPVRRALEGLEVDPESPIARVLYEDVRESMRNGGGPACLRLRVVMTPEEHAAAHPGAFVDAARLAALDQAVAVNYRDRLAPDDLRDPSLLEESRRALEALAQVLGLGAYYDFMK